MHNIISYQEGQAFGEPLLDRSNKAGELVKSEAVLPPGPWSTGTKYHVSTGHTNFQERQKLQNAGAY